MLYAQALYFKLNRERSSINHKTGRSERVDWIFPPLKAKHACFDRKCQEHLFWLGKMSRLHTLPCKCDMHSDCAHLPVTMEMISSLYWDFKQWYYKCHVLCIIINIIEFSFVALTSWIIRLILVKTEIFLKSIQWFMPVYIECYTKVKR